MDIDWGTGTLLTSAGPQSELPGVEFPSFELLLDHHMIVGRTAAGLELIPVHIGGGWSVTDVASDDVLNVRAGPGVEHAIVATLAFDESGVIVMDDLGNGWFLVLGPTGQVGWVNGAFLTPED